MSAATTTGRVLASPKILIGGYDVTGYHNKISAPISREMLMANQFGKTGKARKAGLWDFEVSHSGFWDGGATTIDAVLRGLPGSNVITLCPESGAAGESSAWFGNAITTRYETGGTVGGLTSFTGITAAQDGTQIVNGTILQAATITASGNGTAYEVGDVSADQHIYGALHVTETSGAGDRTLDVVIESDANDSFLSPTTRLTFSQVDTSVSGEFLTPVAGPITDTYWRASYTRSGTSGSFTIYVLFAIF